MPMHRWMQSAAGGTSQRLKPAVAIVRSLSRKPAPAPETLPALLIVVIVISPCSPSLDDPAVYDPVVSAPRRSAPMLLRTIPGCAGIGKRIRETITPDTTDYANCGTNFGEIGPVPDRFCVPHKNDPTPCPNGEIQLGQKLRRESIGKW